VSAGLQDPAVVEGIRTISSRADREHRLELLCVRAKHEVTAVYSSSFQCNPLLSLTLTSYSYLSLSAVESRPGAWH